MSITIKSIELSQIRAETFFRDEEKDSSFKLDIENNGLKVAILVEQESEFQYVLVDGYRRFKALEDSDFSNAQCIVQPNTSEEERIVYRLGKALRPEKRRSSYQMKKMIEQLLVKGKYTIKKIAQLCGVKEETILKYIKMDKINPQLLVLVEKEKRGYSAAVIIENSNINLKMKKDLLEKYFKEKLNLEILKIIKKATKQKAFKKIPSVVVKEFIEDRLIDPYYELKRNPNEVIGKFINNKKLKSEPDDFKNLLMYIKVIQENGEITSFMDKLSQKQKDGLFKLIMRLAFNIYPSLKGLNASVYN